MDAEDDGDIDFDAFLAGAEPESAPVKQSQSSPASKPVASSSKPIDDGGDETEDEDDVKPSVKSSPMDVDAKPAQDLFISLEHPLE